MKKKIKFILVLLFLISISNVAFASYKESILGKVIGRISHPVFIVEQSVLTEKLINKKDNYAEYIFNVLNYLDEEDLVSELEFEYKIKIIPSTKKFPVKYKLLDLESGEEIALNVNYESTTLSLGLEKENHHYKLIVEWDLENNIQDLDENLNVEIEVKGVQKK